MNKIPEERKSEKEKSINMSSIQIQDDMEIADELNDQPSDENVQNNHLSNSIKKSFIKPHFFNYIASYKSSIDFSDSLPGQSDQAEKPFLERRNETVDPDLLATTEIHTNGSTNKDLKLKEIKMTDLNNLRRTSKGSGDGEKRRGSKPMPKVQVSKNWSLILNTVFLINRMRNVQVKRIRTNDLEEHYEHWFLQQQEIENVPIKESVTIKTQNFLKESPTKNTQKDNQPKQYKMQNDEEYLQLEYIAKQTKFFLCLSSGSDENFEYIKGLVNNDPNKFIFTNAQKCKYFVNQKNEENISPLYVATVNGHLKIVKFLCENGGDHLIKNGVKFY